MLYKLCEEFSLLPLGFRFPPLEGQIRNYSVFLLYTDQQLVKGLFNSNYLTNFVLIMNMRYYTTSRLLWFAILMYNILTLTKISDILAIFLGNFLNPKK